ncbi:hypothetical protein TrVGV298_000835 [Trichoderma virens]|nr:hypothetical protein TrVGV298_000835 [Trichoderma virens]
MHSIQLILAFASVAAAQITATIFSGPSFTGESFLVPRLNDCVQLADNVIGNVNSVQLTELPSPYYISCTLYSNDYCRDPAASAIFYAMSLFPNTILPNPKIRSVSCTGSRLLP